MAEEWGPWVEHDCEHVPDLGRVWVDAWVWVVCERTVLRRPDLPPGRAQFWAHELHPDNWILGPNDCSLIIRYRIRRPPALRELIDLVETLPDREAVPA